jgi:hypothetical protein
MFIPHEEIITHNNGKSVSSSTNIFRDLAVPAGLFYVPKNVTFQPNVKETTPTANSINVVSTSLYDNLVKLAQYTPQTNKQHRNTKSHTRNKSKNKNKNKSKHKNTRKK